MNPHNYADYRAPRPGEPPPPPMPPPKPPPEIPPWEWETEKVRLTPFSTKFLEGLLLGGIGGWMLSQSKNNKSHPPAPPQYIYPPQYGYIQPVSYPVPNKYPVPNNQIPNNYLPMNNNQVPNNYPQMNNGQVPNNYPQVNNNQVPNNYQNAVPVFNSYSAPPMTSPQASYQKPTPKNVPNGANR